MFFNQGDGSEFIKYGAWGIETLGKGKMPYLLVLCLNVLPVISHFLSLFFFHLFIGFNHQWSAKLLSGANQVTDCVNVA